jgi:Pyrimidine dimer DNA glycosylase
VHPRHLDVKGLVALWREGLLARAVLLGRTKGYRDHPQLTRFRRRADPVAAIDGYLRHVAAEARGRGYRFDVGKLGPAVPVARQRVHAGQLALEWRHLLRKLRERDRPRWVRERREKPACHPSFRVVPGGREPWERWRPQRSSA